MDRLVSKIITGGLSAGVFLFWWPEHVAGDGLLQLVGAARSGSPPCCSCSRSGRRQAHPASIRVRAIARGGACAPVFGVAAPAAPLVALACSDSRPVGAHAERAHAARPAVDRPRVVVQVSSSAGRAG